jgi:hypothetical protein
MIHQICRLRAIQQQQQWAGAAALASPHLVEAGSGTTLQICRRPAGQQQQEVETCPRPVEGDRGMIRQTCPHHAGQQQGPGSATIHLICRRRAGQQQQQQEAGTAALTCRPQGEASSGMIRQTAPHHAGQAKQLQQQLQQQQQQGVRGCRA